MKTILVLLSSVITLAFAGVGVLTPEIEAEALRLWAAHCETGEGGTDGSSSIYCKKSTEKLEETLQHELELNPAEGTKDQVVFVQPPSYHYKHDVVVSGGGAAGGKTVIYVKPSKNTHEVNIEDKTSGAAAPEKPTLFFLKGDHGGGGGASEAASAAAPVAPSGGYGASEDVPEGEAPAEGARKRRQNVPSDVLSLPAADAFSTGPKRKTVYILRMHKQAHQ